MEKRLNSFKWLSKRTTIKVRASGREKWVILWIVVVINDNMDIVNKNVGMNNKESKPVARYL